MRPRLHHVLVVVFAILLVTAFTLPVMLLWNWPSESQVQQTVMTPRPTGTTSGNTSGTGSQTPTASVFQSGMRLQDSTLDLAKADPDSEYSDVTSRDGSFISLDDGNTYGVWWEPEGFDPAHDIVLVSLGGHAGWATKDFDVWYPEITDRGYGFFTLQWWLGHSLEENGYYEPDEMYAMIRQVLAEKGITPGNVMFQGYSMGSARSYAITAMDHAGDKYFGLTISNSGVWEDDYPPNQEIIHGVYGDQPFADQPWILYCATHDEEHQDWNKCEKMDSTQERIEEYGGVVKQYIKDEQGGHGSFMVNRANVRSALDVADTIVTGS